MAGADEISDDQWRLDNQTSERSAQPPSPPAGVAGLSHQRLTRAVYVVTAEHFAWYLLAAYALATRMVAVGRLPLDRAPATDALAALVIAEHGRRAFALADASWVTIVESWIFAAAGATDAHSRIVVMLCSLLMVVCGFAMRPVLGRAGAIAFAALLAISPSVTYFSRSGSTAIASMAFMMAAIAIAESMRRRPGALRAAALGVAIALWLTADPIGYATAAATVLSLILIGAAGAVRIDHRRLRLRVWWARRRALVIVCAIVVICLWIVLTTAFFHRTLVISFESSLAAAFAPPTAAFHRAVHGLIPILVIYEFTMVALAIVGAAVIVSRRSGDRFAQWSLAWAIVTLATLASVSPSRADAIVAIVLPLALVGAYAADWTHQSERWTSIRYGIAGAFALTLYVQLVTSFVYPAPDTSEAPWRRHALLFWSDPTTSIQTVSECARVRSAVSSAGASAMIPDDAPQVQWYLRDFAPAGSPASANVVVTIGKTQSGALAGNPDAPQQFGFEQWWSPDFRALTIAGAIKYFFTQRAWSDVQIRDLEIAIPPPNKPLSGSPSRAGRGQGSGS
jgi:predicted membrane-bound mannosyltransferase